MSKPDLFVWRDEADAAERLGLAIQAQADALRARQVAPHGQVRSRQIRLEAATTEVLRAQLELAQIQRQAAQP